MAQMQLPHPTNAVPTPRPMPSSPARVWAALATGGIAAAAAMALMGAPSASADPFYCFPPGPDQPWWGNCADGATLDNGDTFHIDANGQASETTPDGVKIVLSDHPITVQPQPHGPVIWNPEQIPAMPDTPVMPDLPGCPPYCVPAMVPNPSGR